MFSVYEEAESPNGGGVFKIYDESESRDEGACLRYVMNRNRHMHQSWH